LRGAGTGGEAHGGMQGHARAGPPPQRLRTSLRCSAVSPASPSPCAASEVPHTICRGSGCPARCVPPHAQLVADPPPHLNWPQVIAPHPSGSRLPWSELVADRARSWRSSPALAEARLCSGTRVSRMRDKPLEDTTYRGPFYKIGSHMELTSGPILSETLLEC
jgi:hypothetical protein